MTNVIEIVENTLLEPAGITEAHLQRILSGLLSSNVDHADLFFQSTQHESWVLEDGIVKAGNYDIDCGVGIRAMSGEKVGFAYSDDIILPALEQAAQAARSIARQGDDQQVQAYHRASVPALYAASNPLTSLADAEKISILQKIDQHARSLDSRVSHVSASVSGSYETVLVMTTEGRLAADIRPLVRISVQVVIEDNGRREQGSSGGGGRHDYSTLLTDDKYLEFASEAVRMAIVNLDAIPAPAGTMEVVLGPGWPGVLLHEAVGHGLEGDFNRKGTSAFTGRMGEQVTSSLCTIVDDGTIEGRRGSLTIDDEGEPTQNTVLIEKGVLKNYMQDSLNARLMGMSPTGNGRRESYASTPLPRMTNTYMLPGESEPEEIIASVKKGIYAVNFDGGQVDITSGKFVFSANEAYLIENGKITAPVKGATLVGAGPEAMQHVTMVGNDLKLDSGVGVCGKDGQSVPVGVGQPTLKIDNITVGGTQN